jgi:hypothetical protein
MPIISHLQNLLQETLFNIYAAGSEALITVVETGLSGASVSVLEQAQVQVLLVKSLDALEGRELRADNLVLTSYIPQQTGVLF